MHSTPQEICERLLAMGDDLYDDTDEGGRVKTRALESLLNENKDSCLTIPMLNPEVRSLNLATAAAIVLFEALRQVRAI